MPDGVTSSVASPALWWAGFGLSTLVYVLLAIAVGARLVVGRIAAERLADERGLKEALDPGSRSWSAMLLARSLSISAAVLFAALGPLREHALFAGFGAALVVAVLGRIAEALVAPRWPEQALGAATPLVRLFDFVFGPLLAPLAKTHERAVSAWRAEQVREEDEDAKEEQLEEYIRDAQEGGILEEEAGDLLREIVDAADVTAREVMTPRVDIVGVPATATLDEAREVFTRSRHSRLIVHDGGLDQVVGVLPMRDLLPCLQPSGSDATVRELMRPVLHVPATKRVLELLRELQEERQQIAVVVDEYGGTAGLVSLEDLVEEIVGEIRDEHEVDDEPLRDDERGALIADGLLPIGDLEERLDQEISDDDVETVGGLVFTRLGRVPRPGDTVEIGPGFTFEVLRMRGRRIAAVKVTPPNPA